MDINSLSRNAIAALAVAAVAGSFLTGSAQATPILSFGQTGNGNTIIGTQSGTSTTIAATNAPITISQIDAAASTPLNAYLDLSFTNSSVATSISGNLEQHFNGSFSMTSGLNGSGIN